MIVERAFNYLGRLKFGFQTETFAKKSFPQQPKPKRRFSAAFVSNIH